jgi:hypothetical protein
MAETLTRPNGKPYRRRAPVRIEQFETYDDGTGVVVVGTHDIERARKAAAPELDEYDLTDVEPQASWWRLIPTHGQQFDNTWIEDPARGAPVVVWQP